MNILYYSSFKNWKLSLRDLISVVAWLEFLMSFPQRRESRKYLKKRLDTVVKPALLHGYPKRHGETASRRGHPENNKFHSISCYFFTGLPRRCYASPRNDEVKSIHATTQVKPITVESEKVVIKLLQLFTTKERNNHNIAILLVVIFTSHKEYFMILFLTFNSYEVKPRYDNFSFMSNILNLKYIIFCLSLILNSHVLAEKNSKTIENDFTEISSVPLKINESARYSFADIVEPLIPAVVNISTIEYVNNKAESNDKEPLREKNPLDWINEFLERLNIPLNLEEVDSAPKSVPLGSGFIIDPSGLIVTNYHVIANVNKISVKLADNTELSAKIIGSDTKTDLALLKVEFPDPLPFVEFGDSNKARVGDWIIAIGNPFGNLGGTVTAGIISSKGRDIDIDTNNIVDNFIQTDAAINNGNSGGPMFNLEQEVIGVNTAIFSPLGTNIGIGFAIPSNTAKPIIERLKKDGKVSRGRLGIVIQDLTDEIAAGLELKDTNGVIVAKVQEGGSGDKAGIKSGDVIIEFAGQAVKNTRKLRVIVAETPIDQEVKIKVIRGGKNLELATKVTVDNEEIIKETTENNDKKVIEGEEGNNLSIVKNNITFSNLTDKLREKFAISKDKSGVIITNTLEEQKENTQEGNAFKVGDLILAVNQEDIVDVNGLEKLYEDAKNLNKLNILLLVERGSVSMFIPLLINSD